MEPIVVTWQGREVRVRHDDERLTPYSPTMVRIRSAAEIASDVDGLRLVLGGSAVGLWRRAG